MIGNQNLDFRQDKLFLDVGNYVSIIALSIKNKTSGKRVFVMKPPEEKKK